MTDYNLSVELDYTQRKVHAVLTAAGTGDATYSAGGVFKITNGKGTVINYATLSNPTTAVGSRTELTSSHDFGLATNTMGLAGGYDTSIVRTDLTGLYAAEPYSNWEWSRDTGNPNLVILSPLSRNIETRLTAIQAMVLDKGTKSYINTPILVRDGDAVLHGSIATVTNKNQITLTTGNNAASNYGSYNYNNCIVQVLSGSASGQTFSIRSNNSTTLYTDRDCTSMSGQIVKIMPYRIVTTYSGWNYNPAPNPTIGTNKGSGGIISRFGVNESIPAKVGSLTYTGGYYSGNASLAHPQAVLAGSSIYSTPGLYSGSIIALRNDVYKRRPNVGDLVYYNPSSSLSVTHTGLIVDVGTYANAAQGDYYIGAYTPDSEPHAYSSYTIYRTNQLDIQTFPELNSNYLCTVEAARPPYDPVTIGILDMTGIPEASTTIHTPSPVVEFAANEYESQFSQVTATSNFHIGPVHLSNGQILDDSITMSTGNCPPYLFFSGRVLNGDPVSLTTVTSQQGFSTQNPNVAHRFSGTYYGYGIMNITASTTFSASETILCQTRVRYGSIIIDRTYTVPVQPAI